MFTGNDKTTFVIPIASTYQCRVSLPTAGPQRLAVGDGLYLTQSDYALSAPVDREQRPTISHGKA